MEKWLRWLSVAPSAVVAWFVALYVALGLRRIALAACPPELVFSGTECGAEWFANVERGLMVFGAGLAAALVVLVPTIVAPNHRARVIFVMFVVGAAIAALPGLSGFYLEFVAALIGGLIAAIVAAKRVARTHDA